MSDGPTTHNSCFGMLCRFVRNVPSLHNDAMNYRYDEGHPSHLQHLPTSLQSLHYCVGRYALYVHTHNTYMARWLAHSALLFCMCVMNCRRKAHFAQLACPFSLATPITFPYQPAAWAVETVDGRLGRMPGSARFDKFYVSR